MRKSPLLLALIVAALPSMAWGQALQNASPSIQDLSPYALKTDVPTLAPVKSVAGQAGNVALPTPCGNASIPSANTVANTTTETAFGSTCTVKANTAVAGNAVHLHVGGVYSAGVLQMATGRVRFTQGTQNVSTDTAVVATGAVGGLANATNQEWWGDIWITFQAGATSIDVQGLLIFQSGSNATLQVPISNISTFAIDPTKDLVFYTTVQWGAAMTANSMTLRTMAAK